MGTTSSSQGCFHILTHTAKTPLFVLALGPAQAKGSIYFSLKGFFPQPSRAHVWL